MNFNFDKFFLVLAGGLLLLTALARTLKNAYDKKVTGRLGILASLLVSVVGGSILWLLISIYTEEPKWQMIAASMGAWSGEKSLDLVSELIEKKFNIKTNKENEEE